MKQIITFVVVLFVIIFVGVWELNYLKESSQYLMSDIKDVYQTSKREDYEMALTNGKTIIDNWKEIRKTWALFIYDEEVDSIEDSMISLISYIDTRNNDEIEKEYALLISRIKHVIDFQSIKAENIF